ncbi:MAG: 23S rRNA (guanosine(2251)-2'-O)-methyltransferase RlmB [Bordetella sp.]|nr:MAG: 23S rRNA (guanosine(2251)-2'-O)-methyltransferase RlmB [Bordetella sp.]
MSGSEILTSFHTVISRLKNAPESVNRIYIDSARRDKRMINFINQAKQIGCNLYFVKTERIKNLIKHDRHNGVVAFCSKIRFVEKNIDEILTVSKYPPLLLILDGITDPHNLGACLRSAEAAGVNAVIAPRNRSANLNSEIVNHVSCGASDSIPYMIVTNLASMLRTLKERGIQLVGTDDKASENLYQINACQPIAWIMGSENGGLRRLTREICDKLISIPMLGSVENLNVSVASAVCLYESVRQRFYI